MPWETDLLLNCSETFLGWWHRLAPQWCIDLLWFRAYSSILECCNILRDSSFFLQCTHRNRENSPANYLSFECVLGEVSLEHFPQRLRFPGKLSKNWQVLLLYLLRLVFLLKENAAVKLFSVKIWDSGNNFSASQEKLELDDFQEILWQTSGQLSLRRWRQIHFCISEGWRRDRAFWESGWQNTFFW